MIPFTLQEQEKIEKRISNALMFYEREDIERKDFLNKAMQIIVSANPINLSNLSTHQSQ